MPLTADPDTGEISSLAYGLDIHAANANEGSIFDDIGNTISKGVPLTGLSIANSFANTGIEVANWFGAGIDKLTVENELGDDEYSQDLKQFYNAHQQGVEATGLILGSIVPGGLAIKGLKALQLVKAGGMTGALARATNIFRGPQQELIQAGIREIEAGDAALYGAINADKYKAIALGMGDQALQALAYEAATAVTMKASPLLDQNGLMDTADNMFFGALVGAGVGGLIEGIGIRSIFNKALLKADTDTKGQELATFLGKGGYVTGDRVAELVRSLDEIPAGTTILGRTKANATRDNAILQAKKILLDIVPQGDNELSNSFFDALLKMKETGGLDKEGMYNYLARLSKIERIDGSGSGVPDGEVFYLNRLAKGEQARWEDLVTPAPKYSFTGAKTFADKAAEDVAIKEAGTSFAYRLRDPTVAPSIAKFSDLIGYEGQTLPEFTTAKEAFEAGHDLFINKRGELSVNPQSSALQKIARPGEARVLTVAEEKAYRTTGKLPADAGKLNGAPLILDTSTGGISDESVPVVGDYGGVKATATGVNYGENFSAQSINAPLDKTYSSIDANARFVWADSRGLLSGDTISPTDIPFLEKMYRDGTSSGKVWGDYIAGLEKRGIGFSGDAELPVTPTELLNRIKDAKDDLAKELLQTDPTLSSEEVARQINAPEKYILNGFKADKPEDYLTNIDESTGVKHVKLWYDIGNIYSNDGMIMRGILDTQYRISLIKDALYSEGAKYFGEGWEKFRASKDASDADISGVGAKFLASSNAAYGSLGQEMERIGRNLTKWYQEKVTEVSTVLSSSAQALRNNEALAAEVGMFRAVRQRTSEFFSPLPDELAAKYGFDISDGSRIAVLNKSFVRDKAGNITDWSKDYVPEHFTNGDSYSAAEAVGDLKGNYTYYKLSPGAAAWEDANRQLNNIRIVARNNLNSAQGLAKSYPLNTYYTPPVNTSEYNHFAYIKLRPGVGGGEDDAAVITAASKGELEAKIAALQSADNGQWSVYTKDMLKTYHEVQGDYEYSRNFAQSQVNSMLARKGILNDVLPETRAEGIIKDYVDWHSRQEMLLSRDHIESVNGQLFEELRQMGARFTGADTSQFGFVPASLKRSVDNPYESYIKTALAVSSKDNYRMWGQTQEYLESFFDSAFNVAKQSFKAASRGLLPFEEASTMAEKFGLGNPYGNGIQALKTYTDVANKLPPERYLTKFVSAANSILGATVIKLDTWQQLIHILSTPILTMSEANSAKKFLTTEIPDGSGKSIPAISKIFFQALRDYFNPAIKDEWMPKYTAAGFIRDPDVLNQHYQLMDQLSLPWGKFSESGLQTKIQEATKTAERLVGTKFSEAYTSWMAARTGHLIFDSAGYSGQELLDNIGTFVNRAKANIVGSQRPVAFQGPLGQAIGLFQTYQFNLMQQLFRYVENGEGKTLALLAGLQTTLFGFQGLPGFSAINNHIIGNAAGNPAHADLYSTVPDMFGHKLGDYLMYGVASNWLQAGLYTRGDINPRQITLLPVNPLNYPAIAGGVRFVSNLYDVAQKLLEGGSIKSSVLMGLEHNGLSRPLSGLAQMAQGFATTSKGSLIGKADNPFGDNSAGLSDLISTGQYARILGARPLDEAIDLDANYRKTLYLAKDNARIEKLGEAVKSTLIANNSPSSEQLSNFASEYAGAGGHIGDFGKKVVSWSRDANSSIVNKVFRDMKSPINQQMMKIMGGEPLPDYTTAGGVATPNTAAGSQLPTAPEQ